MVLICCLEHRDESHDDVTSINCLYSADNQSILKWRHHMSFVWWALICFYLFARLLLRCAGGVGRRVKGLLWAGAGIRHDRESARSQKDVKRYEAEVLGDGGLVGRPGDAVVASPALLLDLDDPDASAVTAEPAVLPGAAVTRGGVRTACRVVAAAFLLGATHLCRQTMKGRAAFTLMKDFILIVLKVKCPWYLCFHHRTNKETLQFQRQT